MPVSSVGLKLNKTLASNPGFESQPPNYIEAHASLPTMSGNLERDSGRCSTILCIPTACLTSATARRTEPWTAELSQIRELWGIINHIALSYDILEG
jgi:hypothetical protein